MKSEITKMAKLLRTSEEVILNLKKKMEKVSGKKGSLKKLSRTMMRKLNKN